MNKKLVAFLSILSLSLSLLHIPAHSATKAGAKCTKAGIKSVAGNKIFTCVKSGRKLVWNKGVPLASPFPTSSKPPFQDEVSLKIDQIRMNALRSETVDVSIQTFIFQDGATQEIESKTKRSLLNALPVYKKLGFNTTDGLILVAKDINWVKQELLRNQCNNSRPIPDRPGFYYGSTCKNGNGAITSVHWESEKFGDGLDGLYFNHVIPHEYFHQIQEQLTTFGNGDFPKWFWEGSAQFFTNQAWSTWNTNRTYLEWYQYWWRDLRPDMGPSACKDATIETMSNPSGMGIQSLCAYSKGQLIVEYLVFKYGLGQYRSLYTANTTNDWRNFNIVFKKVTGQELSDFYVEAQNFITKRGW
jgi:hypothetical protein